MFKLRLSKLILFDNFSHKFMAQTTADASYDTVTLITYDVKSIPWEI